MAFAGALKIIEDKSNLTLYLFHMDSQGIMSISVMVSVVCFAVFLSKFLWRLRMQEHIHAPLYWFVQVSGGFIVLAVLLVCLWFGFITEPRYYVYDSPGEQDTIVIKEEAFMLAGYGSMYVKENAFFMKRAGDYSTDDGNRPFQNDDYRLEWGEDQVTIIYGYGSMGIQKELTIQLRD